MTEKMQAIVYTEYGSPDVLHLKDVDKPTPKDNQIRVRVHVASVSYGDLLARNMKNNRHQFNMPSVFWLPARLAFGYRTPKNPILGAEFSGVVESIGKDVTRFKVGDSVFGYPGQAMGGYAEYLCIAEDGFVAHKPQNLTHQEATLIPGGALTALSLLKKADIQQGQKVLINGASGTIGSAAVQFAKHYGAEVTGVCSTLRVDYVKSLGADKVIDYTQEDFTQNGETYDLIFDILGRSSFVKAQQSLTSNGRYLMASFKARQLFRMMWTSLTSSKKMICALSSEKPEDLLTIKAMVEAGKLTAIVDRCYPLENTADAHRYVESGNKRAGVVIGIG